MLKWLDATLKLVPIADNLLYAFICFFLSKIVLCDIVFKIVLYVIVFIVKNKHVIVHY